MIFAAALLVLVALCRTALAGEVAVSRFLPDRSEIVAKGERLELHLAFTQAVPYRVQTKDDSIELVLRSCDWSTGIAGSAPIRALALEPDKGGGECNLRASLDMRAELASAEFSQIGEVAVLRLAFQLAPSKAGVVPRPGHRTMRPIIAIDPGHGGKDPGAQVGGLVEKDLVLRFAQEFAAALEADGYFRPLVTREDDSFLYLAERMRVARAAGAAAFVSIHADTLETGYAEGITVFTLADEAGSGAIDSLVARENREGLIGDADLSGEDDSLTGILLDLAQRDTMPRTETLAGVVVEELRKALGKMREEPHLRAGFHVLKSPQMPSFLLELGFMSSERDRKNMQSKAWRNKVIEALIAGLKRWHKEDEARQTRFRH